LVVKDIQQTILGGGSWEFIVPAVVPANAEDDPQLPDTSVDASESDCDVSIFYDSSIWELRTKGARQTGRDSYDPRFVVWGVFRRPGSSENLAVFNTHGPLGNIWRSSQYDVMVAAVNDVKKQFPGVHVVFVGDFNSPDKENFNLGRSGLELVNGATGGNYQFDWVFSTPYQSSQITYGALSSMPGVCSTGSCSLDTGSDHEPVLIEMVFSPASVPNPRTIWGWQWSPFAICCTSKHVEDEIKTDMADVSVNVASASALAKPQSEDGFQVKMASVNFQTPEVDNWDARAKIFQENMNGFFSGVEIFAMQETKEFKKGGYTYGGDLVVKDIQQTILGGGSWEFIVPAVVPANAEDDPQLPDTSVDASESDCDVSIFYDSSIWELRTKGARQTGRDSYDPRFVVWGVFRRPGSSENLAVFNTHGPLGNIWRSSQYDVMVAAVNDVKKQFPGVHVIFVGDFNRPDKENFNLERSGLELVDGATGGNLNYDWVFSTPYQSRDITYGALSSMPDVCSTGNCSVNTGSDHQPVLISLTF